MLALPGYYDQMVHHIVQQQSANRKQGLTNAFKGLLVGVDSNLQTKIVIRLRKIYIHW